MKRTTTNGDTLLDELSRTLLRSPNVTRAKMFGGIALKVKDKVFACFYKGKTVGSLCPYVPPRGRECPRFPAATSWMISANPFAVNSP